MNQVSLVEQLKEVLKAQNESLRQKHSEVKTLRAENARLTALVQELEIENEGLKGLLARFQTDGPGESSENAQNGKGKLHSSTSTPLSGHAASPELYTTALSSPKSPEETTKTVDATHDIATTLSSLSISTPKSTLKLLGSPKKTLSRTESRKTKRKSCYELSPDISDKHIQVLENCYGGKKRANNAARVIQQHYRTWAMKRTYLRLRTQSEARRTSVHRRRSNQGSLRSPTSSGSLSPTRLPMNLNLNITDGESSTELGLKSPEAETRTRLSSSKEEFKPIQTDLNIDSNFRAMDKTDTRQVELSVHRMSEDISSIEISKNLLNDSMGKKILFDEVFHQILSPRKGSISSTRSDSFRASRGEIRSEITAVDEEKIEKTCEEMVNGAIDVDKKDGRDAEKVEDEKNGGEKKEMPILMEERPTDHQDNLDENELELEGRDKFGNSCESLNEIPENYSYSWPALDQLVHGDDTASLSGNSLSPSSSIMQTFYEDKERDVRIGINHFNRKPKKGITYLLDTGVLDDNPESVCKFLREEPGINKQKIGEYLGDLQNPFSQDVLQSFVRTIVMAGKEIDEALRFFQTFFRMPGEAQKIERLVEEFSAAYVEANPGRVSDNPDTILVLAFAIIMLNTDLHSPNVKRKMSKEEFTRNLRGTNDGEDLPAELLCSIYDRVEKKQFRTGPDNLDAIFKYEKQILGKVPWTTLALAHRQLRQVTTLYEIQHGGKRKEKPHHRVVFLFNDMMIVTKERGQAGQKGNHYFSYKNSYQMCDIKFQLFNNSYYKYGIRILNKVNSDVLVVFHAKKEDIRKAFYTELKDCIEETYVMENERISFEKTRQLSALSYHKHDLEETMSLSLPRSHLQGKKKTPDSLSLVNEPAIISEGELMKNSILSSSLQDLHQSDGGFYEDGLLKSRSVTSIDYGSDSTSRSSGFSSASNGSVQNLNKRFGLFNSKRMKNATQRKLTKSTGSLEEIKAMRRKTSSASDQRKSEFFVTSPIAT